VAMYVVIRLAASSICNPPHQFNECALRQRFLEHDLPEPYLGLAPLGSLSRLPPQASLSPLLPRATPFPPCVAARLRCPLQTPKRERLLPASRQHSPGAQA
jgi:hypothetical protein